LGLLLRETDLKLIETLVKVGKTDVVLLHMLNEVVMGRTRRNLRP
jgi:hypothetical protein